MEDSPTPTQGSSPAENIPPAYQQVLNNNPFSPMTDSSPTLTPRPYPEAPNFPQNQRFATQPLAQPPKKTKRAARQTFLFVDQTPDLSASTQKAGAEAHSPNSTLFDAEKNRSAQQRRRSGRGQFLCKEVASRLEELEKELQYKETECDTLRKSISEREAQMQLLKEQIHGMLNTAPQFNYAYVPLSQPQGYYPLQTTNRNFVVSPSPNPRQQFPFQGQEAFKKKIDYSKIQLRKTESSLDEEKREVLSSQQEWDYRQAQQEFMRKLQEQSQWANYQYQAPPRVPAASTLYGGAPSNIYSETHNKVGNLPVSAFTTKVNLSQQRQQLGKRATTERSLERMISDEQREELKRMVQMRIEMQEQMKFRQQQHQELQLYQQQMLKQQQEQQQQSFWAENSHSPMSLASPLSEGSTPNTISPEAWTSFGHGHPFNSNELAPGGDGMNNHMAISPVGENDFVESLFSPGPQRASEEVNSSPGTRLSAPPRLESGPHRGTDSG